eukprot:13260380-Heterocapsa_arctica.AAC.1
MYNEFMRPPEGGASDGARRGDAARLPDAVEVPVPDDERSLALAGSFGGRMIAAVVDPPGTLPSASASGVPTMTAASTVDLKGLARPKHFDGSDEKWLDWKYGFKNVMSL